MLNNYLNEINNNFKDWIEVFDIQTRALMQRLKATGIKKVVIGISGGLDSTLALLVCTMAFKQLNYDSKDIIAITMPRAVCP